MREGLTVAEQQIAYFNGVDVIALTSFMLCTFIGVYGLLFDKSLKKGDPESILKRIGYVILIIAGPVLNSLYSMYGSIGYLAPLSVDVDYLNSWERLNINTADMLYALASPLGSLVEVIVRRVSVVICIIIMLVSGIGTIAAIVIAIKRHFSSKDC